PVFSSSPFVASSASAPPAPLSCPRDHARPGAPLQPTMRVLPLLSLLSLSAASPIQLPLLWPSPFPSSPRVNSTSTKVPLTLGVMSKCPDAEICETVMDRVLDTHTGGIGGGGKDEVVGDLVKLGLVFIAKCVFTLPTSERVRADLGSAARREQANETYGVSCMHGELECKGNVQQLCAIEHWGEESMGITKSCTVMLNGRKICIHDGVWKDCDAGHEVGDFVRQITDEWNRLNPKETEMEDAAREVAELDDEEDDEWELI
ncbi:SPOSA6832_04880, partial [Sporobolomyces salmonicolor]